MHISPDKGIILHAMLSLWSCKGPCRLEDKSLTDARAAKHADTSTTIPPKTKATDGLQGWFTFYVHSKPGAHDFQEGSIFAGRTIEHRIKARYLSQCPITPLL